MPEHAEDEVAGQPQVVGVAFGVSGQLGPFGVEPTVRVGASCSQTPPSVLRQFEDIPVVRWPRPAWR